MAEDFETKHREALKRAGCSFLPDGPEPEETQTLLSRQEQRVLKRLVQAWAEFVALEQFHTKDAAEFEQAIRYAQDLILARPARKWLRSSRIRLDEVEP